MVGEFDLLVPAGSIVTLFVDTGRSAGTTYSYRLNAMNSADTSEWTAPVTLQTMPGVPGKPDLTPTIISSTEIRLTWTAPVENGSPINRYELEVWDRTNKRWNRIGGTLTASDLRYNHRGLDSETSYVYRVRAVNGSRVDSGQGPWSTIKFGTTD